MPANVEPLANTDILSGQCCMPREEVYRNGSEKFFRSRFDWPTEIIHTKNKAPTKDVMTSQGSSGNGSNADINMGGTDVSLQTVTEKESLNVSLVNVEGTWGSLETNPCLENVLTGGSSSNSHVTDAGPLSVKSKRLIPSSTAISGEHHDYLRIDHDSPSPAPLLANAPEKNPYLGCLKQVKSRLSWGEEVMIGILGQDPNDSAQLSPSVPASLRNSPMRLDRNNSKTQWASSEQWPQLKMEASDCEMDPVAHWKNNARRTLFRDRNLQNRVYARKSRAIFGGFSTPRKRFPLKVVKSNDPTEVDGFCGRPASVSSGVTPSKNTSLPIMYEQSDIGSRFTKSGLKSLRTERNVLNGLKEASETESLDNLSPRSNISKLVNSEPQKNGRSPDWNASLDSRSMVSMITGSSTSILKTSDECANFQKDCNYPVAPKYRGTVADAQPKEKVARSRVERKVMPKWIEPQRYLPRTCFPGQMYIQQGGPIVYPHGGAIACIQPVNGGFVTPQLSSPLISVPEHGMGQPTLYRLPAVQPMIISQPLISPVFSCGAVSPAGVYHSHVYHQTPVQFQLPPVYQQQVQKRYLVDKVDQPGSVNLPLTTENVNMHNKAFVARDSN